MSTPFIIAEIGSNFLSRNDVMHSITQAKMCGADAVKFQLYSHKELYGFDGEIGGALEPLWLGAMKEKADAVGIELMCTAFSPEGYDMVDPYVKRHKIASSELTHKRILQKVRSLGKPVILSTAAAMEDEICEALSILGGVPIALMYCVGAYPARVVNLSLIAAFKYIFKTDVGYSDHTTDVLTIPIVASRMGASIIEKHVSFIESETPDKPHSLNGEEFKLMCLSLKEPNHHQFNIGPTTAERDMVLKHRRRLIALKDLSPGDVLKENENFGIFRSKVEDTSAWHGFSVDEANGKTVNHYIKAGLGIIFHLPDKLDTEFNY